MRMREPVKNRAPLLSFLDQNVDGVWTLIALGKEYDFLDDPECPAPTDPYKRLELMKAAIEKCHAGPTDEEARG